MKLAIFLRALFSMLIAALICMFSGCATAPKADVESQAAHVTVYEPGKLLQAQYEHVRYLWAGSWRTALWLPGASSPADGIASLQAEAGRLGANGLINVSCLDQGHFIGSKSRTPSFLCYGHAIRVR